MAEAPKTDVESAQQLVELSQLTAADFEPLLQSKFVVDLNYMGLAADGSLRRRSDVYPVGEDVSLELVEVTRRKPYSQEFSRDPFALLLLGSDKVPLLSDVHLLVHEVLGKLAVLLTPVNSVSGNAAEDNPEDRYYECVMN